MKTQSFSILMQQVGTPKCNYVLRRFKWTKLFKHEEKAKILWESFKHRLGTSEFNHMHFNLQELLEEVDGLAELDIPFSNLEINNIVK
jgi:hypothetical protein